MEQPLKIWPNLWYGLICALPPTVYRGVLTLNAVFNELVAPEFPHSKDIFIVVGWQRGLGRFAFHWRLRDEDGNFIAETEPTSIELTPDEAFELTMPYAITVYHTGYYLLEGFLDGESTFTTTFRVSRRKQE